MENQSGKPPKERLLFFGSYVDPLTMQESLDYVDRVVKSRESVQHVVINVAKLVMMQKDEELRRIVNSCGLINADGQGIVWGARLVGLSIPERVAGVDLFLEIVKYAPKKGHRLYFLGAKLEVVRQVVEIFQGDYPDLQVAGFHDGYFKQSEEPVLVRQIHDSKADILFVAMSSPNKEIFLDRWRKEMGIPFVMGVGGSFDVVARVTLRAPVWMQKIGLEWFYRLLNEPGRMMKRYVTTNTIFLWMLLKAMIFGRKKYGCS